MNRNTAVIIVSYLLCLVLAIGVSPARTVRAEGVSVNIDGDSSEWPEEQGIEGTDNYVDSWNAAYDSDHIYIRYQGTSSSQWDYNYANTNYKITVSGKNGVTREYCVVYNWDEGQTCTVRNTSWQEMDDATAAVRNGAHLNNPGPYTIELMIDKSVFGDDFQISFDGGSTSSEGMTDFDTVGAVTVPAEKTYEGIDNDGNYDDWDAVSKSDVSGTNHNGVESISEVAAVWDGDSLHIYIRDGQNANASQAGVYSNGKFAITSDLGYETDIQLTYDGRVEGIDGVIVSYVGDRWEITIPASELPNYTNSLNFGYYRGETLIPDIMNVQGNDKTSSFNGVEYNSDYRDWTDYPHGSIGYTPDPDAKVALYQDGNTLYGHVVTDNEASLRDAGGEFTQAVTICFNSTDPSSDAFTQGSETYSWRVVAVDADGNINWNPANSNLAQGGTYEYYLMDLGAWGTSSNINDLNEADTCYGRMSMTIGVNGKDEMEFALDLAELARKFNCDVNELRVANAQFARIGNQWITTAGTSTAPVMGLAICGASVLIGFFFFTKKKNGI